MKLKLIGIQTLLLSVLALVQPIQAADYVNSIGMKFNTIPAGSFYMGSCKMDTDKRIGELSVKKMDCPSMAKVDNLAISHEIPQHIVQITQSFQMGTFEVTLGQFKQFIAQASRIDLLTDNFNKFNSRNDNAAVVQVSWNDTQSFIRWLNKKENGNRYRLPTEAEWEYAAKAGSISAYPWGNKSQIDQYAWYDNKDDSKGTKYPYSVGIKQPNKWGLYDMHGNVWEWIQDWYGQSYYSVSVTNDPKGPNSGQSRVIRGGSWYDCALSLRSTNRELSSPGFRYYLIGFRLVRQHTINY